MGANDKLDATFQGSTPDTQIVEHAYVAYRSSKVYLVTAHHEFTRWIEQVRTEAKAEALNDMAKELESQIAGYAGETAQTRAGKDIIYRIRRQANQYKEEQ